MRVRRHACLMGCSHACNAAVQACGKMAYTLGRLAPEPEAAARARGLGRAARGLRDGRGGLPLLARAHQGALRDAPTRPCPRDDEGRAGGPSDERRVTGRADGSPRRLGGWTGSRDGTRPSHGAREGPSAAEERELPPRSGGPRGDAARLRHQRPGADRPAGPRAGPGPVSDPAPAIAADAPSGRTRRGAARRAPRRAGGAGGWKGPPPAPARAGSGRPPRAPGGGAGFLVPVGLPRP